jgi:hypothetical protein
VQPESLQGRERGGPEEPLGDALGRSQGGLITKIHMACDASGVPLRFMLSPGHASDIAHCWIRYEFPVNQGDHASAVAGYWLEKL